MFVNGRLWMKEEACALCTGGASLFPSRQSRANAALSSSSKLHHHHLPPSLSYLLHHQQYAYTPATPGDSNYSPFLRSINHPPIPPDCITRQSIHPPGVARFVSLQKTNSLGHHHQKVRSQLQTAIDRNPRRHSTDPPPRGNDTALLRTRRCSKIANKQALASCSQSRGHSSASE